ncbi:conserved hypothetical protein [Pediculus humanus corporis]|uniref:Uncharacterized protein n=1 Tax=Pediculus humanus subsp. corporis TaxID=121224 RepID=E0VBR1_PEDHC|nr:uncharacterized protein Phum_PHUM067000 [Pediculus humanus corporis]EEB10817.1 conserved hypothetical protein [Pediculus humanus corporis]
MSCDDESGNSFPFIDDDDDGGGVDDVNDDVDTVDDFHYKLNIIEKYKNKNRNIEIKNQSFSNEFINNPPPTIAPLAYENDLSDDKTDDNNNNNNKSSVGNSRDSTILKLVVRGWNSTISIQGLDKKSNISFNRKIVQGKKKQTTTKPTVTTTGKNVENVQTNNSIKESTKKKKWKMLTKSIISKSKKFDKKSDERYPKYVLLKNEEEEEAGGEGGGGEGGGGRGEIDEKKKIVAGSLSNPNEKTTKSKKIIEIKKNKMIPTKTTIPNKTPSINVNSNDVEEIWKTGSESQLIFNVTRRSSSQGRVFNEIENVLKEALKLCPEVKATFDVFKNDGKNKIEKKKSVPFCNTSSLNPPGKNNNRYTGNKTNTETDTRHNNTQNDDDVKKNGEKNQNNHYDKVNDDVEFSERKNTNELLPETYQPEKDFDNLQFGILSSFFSSPILIMKTCKDEIFNNNNNNNDEFEEANALRETSTNDDVETLPSTSNILLKSKIYTNDDDDDTKKNVSLDDCPNRLPVSDENDVTKSEEETETTTKYYCIHTETEAGKNRDDDVTSTTTTTTTTTEFTLKTDQTDDNLLLTKTGYKVSDQLSKLSLNFCQNNKKKIIVDEKPEMDNIEKLNDNDNNDNDNNDNDNNNVVITFKMCDSGNIKLSIIDNKNNNNNNNNIVLSIGNDNNDNDDDDNNDEKKIQISKNEEEKVLTKEANVGTDENFFLAGGNFPHSKVEECTKNLSPRKSHLLKNLKEKLKSDNNNYHYHHYHHVFPDDDKIIREFMENEKIHFGGIFLLQKFDHKSVDDEKFNKKKSSCQTLSTLTTRKNAGNIRKNDDVIEKLREYYCQDCMATMRIFEDENPSVKTMIDKFETIIQLKN